MFPTIEQPESIGLDRIKESAREVLAIAREVEKGREGHDPGTQESYTLLNLAQTAARLVYALPVEMLPEEEWRYVSPSEYAAVGELLEILASVSKD
jgi:hypothetical protein